MKKASFLILLALTIIGQAFAQTRITEDIARQTAKAFIHQHTTFQKASLQLVSASNIFIYNIDNQGFVIISGNTVLSPILAYSDQDTFPDMEEAPENLRSWIEHYGDMIAFAETNHLVPEADIQRQWDEALQGIVSIKSNRSVSPLVSTHWNQDCYYNEYCPEAPGSGWGGWGGGPCGHAYAGCVACAMAQVMKYWNHPAQGTGSHSYTHSSYGQQSANFGATTYQWSQMPNEIYSHNDAVATLMYHCGVSVNMNYGPSGSGAYSNDVETAMRSYFGYCGAKYRQKSSYSDEVWIAMLEAELDLSHPIYYSGSNGDSGHAFVCDGYDNNDLMHFNFGWSGSGDGYYSVNDVNGFNQGQAVVMNVFPMSIQADDNGIIYVSPDGEGDGSSWENATDKLQFATALSRGDNIKVWVKKGTYYGDITNSEGAFYITENNRVYGSFNGDEAPDFDLSLRDFEKDASILDGQGERRVLLQDQAFTTATAAVWDGFILQNGAVGSGAGAYLNNYVTLANCTITDNAANMYGGGVYINSTGGTSHVSLNNCTISNNSSSMGGGICDRIGATYSNCYISNNTASTKGGGLYLYINTEPVFKNCVFGNNTANQGGAMYARGRFTAYNCDFVTNLASESCGGIFNEEHHNQYYNCIIWGNVANGLPSQMEGVSDFEYCAVQGGVEGTGNINLPAENDGEELGAFTRFIRPAEGAGAEYHGDWDLQSGSICLNAGKPNTTGLGSTDIAGNPRIQHGRVEIGAYESCASLTETEETVCDNEPYFFNGTELTESGHYMAILPTAECDSVVWLDLSFEEGPDVNIEGESSVPLGESIVLTASGAETYLWSTGETTESITVSPTVNTTYSVVGTNENGCTDEASIDVTVMQGNSEWTEHRVAVWPNPTKGLLHFEMEGNVSIEIRNPMGQLIQHFENTGIIDIQYLENGIYFLNIVNENGGNKVFKVVKE